MDDRRAGIEAGRALARSLKAAAAARRAPEPPAALRDIAWGRTAARARGAAADFACAAALAACLACSVAFGRAEGALAARLDGPAIAAALEKAASPASLEALLRRISIESR